jgi:hypothetical protein
MATPNANQAAATFPLSSSPQGTEIPMADAPNPSSAPSSHRDDSYAAHALARVRDALHGLRYGVVTVVVQDGVVVQVERTEKVRLSRR